MVSFFGIIAFVAASYGLYAQIHKKEIAQAVAAYIVTVLTIIIAVVSFRNSPNTTLVEQEDIAKESAKPTSTSTIQPVDSEDDGESEKKLNTKETMSFTGNKISGIMDGEDSREEQYMATQTGIYRFDFDIDDVNKGYCFYILDSKQEEVQRGYSSDSGINAYMESGMEYTLVVEHSEQEEEVEYCISIHSPDGIENIEGKSIKGEISYIGQEKEYIYSAQRSGIYRFDFDIDDVNNDYVFQVYDSKNNELLYKNFSDKGGTIELTKGDIYKVTCSDVMIATDIVTISAVYKVGVTNFRFILLCGPNRDTTGQLIDDCLVPYSFRVEDISASRFEELHEVQYIFSKGTNEQYYSQITYCAGRENLDLPAQIKEKIKIS